jgi:flagellar FliL protein
MTAATAEPPVKKPRGKLRLVLAASAVLVAGGGGGAYWWHGHQAPATAEAGDPANAHAGGGDDDDAKAPSGALPFAPFIVNLADAGGSRYLKADIRLLVSGIDHIKELEEDEVVMLRLRSAILEHLSQQTSDLIVTPEGKETLKRQIAERCTQILGHARVTDVLFAEFVVQY